MLIGDLSEETGVSARALRHYESLGLLQAQRAENGYRHYAREQTERVHAVRFLLAAGLNLATIAEILPAIMYKHCKLADPDVRSVIQREASKIKLQMEQLLRSYTFLTDALGKGIIRRAADSQTHELAQPPSSNRGS